MFVQIDNRNLYRHIIAIFRTHQLTFLSFVILPV